MADRYLLESSATDGYLLEDGSGVLIVEGVGVSDVVGTDTGAVTEAGVGLATAVGVDSSTLTEAATGLVATASADSSAVSEAITGLITATGVDASTVSDAGLVTALSAVSDSAAFSDVGIAAEGPLEAVGIDSAAMAEAITALLAEVSATDEFLVTDRGPEPPPVPPVPKEDVFTAPRRWHEEPAPELDEALLVSAVAAWETYY